jgi:Protein of unknown function (DUF3152)
MGRHSVPEAPEFLHWQRSPGDEQPVEYSYDWDAYLNRLFVPPPPADAGRPRRGWLHEPEACDAWAAPDPGPSVRSPIHPDAGSVYATGATLSSGYQHAGGMAAPEAPCSMPASPVWEPEWSDPAPAATATGCAIGTGGFQDPAFLPWEPPPEQRWPDLSPVPQLPALSASVPTAQAQVDRRSDSRHRRRAARRSTRPITLGAAAFAGVAVVAGFTDPGGVLTGSQQTARAATGIQVDQARFAASGSVSRPMPGAAAASQRVAVPETASGILQTVAGNEVAPPGAGTVIRYRVDVEEGLPFDPREFAETSYQILNDPRSWGEGGTRSFERVDEGPVDFVLTLASPAVTDRICRRSGADTSEQKVSCNAQATNRVMINGYRWGQGAETYGEDLAAYRTMLVNHEVGHRLGHGHLTCSGTGQPAPVMMQQTKTLQTGPWVCRPNPWPFPDAR